MLVATMVTVPAPPEPHSPRPHSRRWRPLALGAGLVVALLAAAEFSGWVFLRGPLQAQLSRSLGTPVQIDAPFALRLFWRPRAQIAALQITGPAGDAAASTLLDAQGLRIEWRWRDVWRWQAGAPLRIEGLQAQHLRAAWQRDAQGAANWPRASALAAAEATAPPLPQIGWLQVHDGRIDIDDVPTRTRLEVQLDGEEREGAEAAFRMTARGSYRGLPLALRLHSGAMRPLLTDGDGRSAQDDVPLSVEGRVGATTLRFVGQAAALAADRRLRGHLQLRGPSLASVAEPLGLTLPQTPPFALDGRLAHADGLWQLRVTRAAIGGSLLEGEFQLDPRAQPVRLQGRLGGPRLRWSDLGPAVGADEPPAARDRVLPQREFDLPSLRAMDADVQVAIDELDFGSQALAPLHDLRTRLQLQGGVLQLQQLSAEVAGGRFRGNSQLDATVEPARWDASLRFNGIDVARWIAGLRQPVAGARSEPAAPVAAARAASPRSRAARPTSTTAPPTLTGTLRGGLQVSGRGRSTAQILGSLDGRVQVALRDGALSHLATEALGLDVAQALGVLLRGDRPLPLSCALLDLGVQRGVAQLLHGSVENADTAMQVEGRVDLGEERLALRMTARPKDVSPFSLRAPVTVGGHFVAPEVGVEMGPVAARIAGAAVLGAAVAPLAALLPFIDLGADDIAEGCALPRPAAGR